MRISDWSSDVCSSDPRFLVLGKQEPGQSGDDITSVVMTAHRNQPGALFKLLQPFAESGLDLTRLESREIRNSVVTDYYFFVDFAGHAADPKVRAVLETIRSSAAFFKILGSYRSEERRVWQECVSTCKSVWVPFP